MSDGGITLEQFEQDVKSLREESRALEKRRAELRNQFVKLAESVRVGDEDADEDDFRDLVFEVASESFYDSIDYEYSRVEPGSVEIWEHSNC